MKNLLLVLLLSSPFTMLYSQTHIYTHKEEYADGHLVSKNQGIYKLVYETGTDGVTPLFTLYHNGVEQGWFSYVRSEGKGIRGSVIFSKELYYDTRIQTGSLILVSEDKREVLIFWGNNRTEYKK